jgi:hypothetical protein
MAQDQSLETQTIAISTTSGGISANFAGGIQQAYFTCDNDCFVSFDQPATTSSLKLKANYPPTRVSFGGANVQNIYAITSSGTGTLYILGVRGRG